MSRPESTEFDVQTLGYEIAEPISYETFPIDGEPSSGATKSDAPSKSVRSDRSARYAEEWDDAQKEKPQASDYDSRKFRPSELAHEPRLTRGTQRDTRAVRSEEHTSELQSHVNLVCRLLLEKKKTKQ